jgi:signal transduction histidine kinase/ActR/RegA family two-component response regulator
MPSSAGLWRRLIRPYSLAFGVFVLALWAELALYRSTAGFTFLLLAPATSFAAWVGGRIAGLATVLLAAVATDYFLLGPGTMLSFGTAAEAAALATFTAAWSAIAVLAGAVSMRTVDEIEARSVAERAAAQAHRVAQTTAALGLARTSSEAIESIAQEPLHWLRADAGVIFLVNHPKADADVDEDATQITVARAVGYPLHAGESWPLDDFGPASPFRESLRRVTPVVIKSRHARKPEFAEWARRGPWEHHEASLVLPIVVDRRVVALVQLDFLSPREFTADDHEYIHTLCSRAAQALSRTRMYEAVERARADAESLKARADAELVERQRTEQALRASETRYRALATRTTRLHALTASLSEAASMTAVAQVIVEQAHLVVGASEGALDFIDGDVSAFEPGFCAAEALTTRRPVFVGSLAEAQERFWRSASAAADRGFASASALPLIVESAPIGVLEFHFSAPVNFDAEYQSLLISVAQHCTQALDRARLYEQAKQARADAEAANRLKDEFVSTVSHELRTPLNAILGWTSMLRSGSIDAEVVPQAIESVYRNASRQAKLVDDLLDFSRIAGGRTTLEVEVVDAPKLIRGIVESVTPLAVGSQIEILLSPMPDAAVRGDVRRLEQVFVNLLGNALKFTEAGGHIMVSARVTGRNLEVRVADDGIGIDPEFLPHVFDRFRQGDSTTTRNHAGLGLGLSIAKQLIEAHRGSIRVESGGPGKGTAFIVTLPLEGDVVRRQEVQPAEDQPRLDGVRVLVVDDEQDSRDLIGRALEGRGATITLAGNSSQAIEILERTDIDVLLADIAMPGEDGYELIRRIRSSTGKKLASLPAAAVTAHARHDERQRALAAGFHMHVAKPVEPFELVRTVNRLVHDRRRSRRSGI